MLKYYDGRKKDMKLIEKVKEFVGHKNIVYSSAICSDCQMAEEFFDKNDIDIEVKQIENPEYRKELKEKHGRVLVPTIILGNEKFIGFEQNQEKTRKKLGLS
jgi:glutaredoxin 3